jgi:hypothetical protein
MSIVVQLTNQGAALLQASEGPITLGQFVLGSAVNYVPEPTDVNIHGTPVFSGVPSAPLASSANIVRYGCILDYPVGNFYFGELGLFTTGGVLFALVAWSELIQKLSSTESPPGNSIRIDVYVALVGQNASMWIETAESNNSFRVAVLSSPDVLPTSQQAIPNVYIISGYAENSQSSFFAYTDQNAMWQFDAYEFGGGEPLTVVSSDSRSITVLADQVQDNMIPSYIGQVILEFSNGALFSVCRYVTTVVFSGIYATFSFDTAILMEPAAGDQAIIFIRQIASTTITVPPATHSSLGTVQIGNSLTVTVAPSTTPGIIDVNYNEIPYPVTSVNGLTGAVVLNNTNIEGFAAVAYNGEYSSLIGTPTPYTLPIATTSVLGGVKAPVDGNLVINDVSGVIDLGFTPVTSVDGLTGAVTLPLATTTAPGLMQVGAGLQVTDGIVSADATVAPVTSVSGQTGAVVIEAVDNSDASGTTLIVNNGSTTGVIKLKTIVAGTNVTLNNDGNGNLVVNAATQTSPVTSVSGQTGAVVVSAIDNNDATGTTLIFNSGSTTGTIRMRTLVAGSNITLSNDTNGNVVITGASGYTLPPATTSTLGGVIVGTNLSVNGSGVLSVPLATTSTAGVVTVGSGLSVTSGVISVTATGGVTSFNTRTGAVTLTTADVQGVNGAITNASNTFSSTNDFTTGSISVPTQTAGNNTNLAASTAFVQTTVSGLVTTAQLAAAKYYDIPGGATGTPSASQIMLEHVAVRTVTWSAGFAGSQGFAATAATALTTFTITVNGTTIGTMTFAASATTATFALTGTNSITAGQVLRVIAPASPDATLANVSFTFLGVAT